MISHYVNLYGYSAIFWGILLEDFGIPSPGETLLIAGSISASQGHLLIGWIMLLGILGAFIGDNIGYAIGHFGGRRFALKYGRYVFLNENRLNKLETFFDKHGNKAVVISRFIAGLRQFNGILAGIGNMKWPKFLIFNFLGAVLWVLFWSGLAYFLGSQAEILFETFKPYIFMGLVFIALIVYCLVKRKNNCAES